MIKFINRMNFFKWHKAHDMNKLLLSSFLLLCLNGYGQVINQMATYKGGNASFSEFVSKEIYRTWKSSKERRCIESTTFVDFDEHGNFQNFKFYEAQNTPSFFRELVTAALKATKWKLANTKSR